MGPAEVLRSGCAILDPVLVEHGFNRISIKSGPGSGGEFARTDYVRGKRRLELHFRYSLGLVTYHLDATRLAHEAYMRAVLGRRGDNQYPGFSEDPLDGFRHLRHDLEHHCSEFLRGSDSEFERVLTLAAAQARVTGFRAISAE